MKVRPVLQVWNFLFLLHSCYLIGHVGIDHLDEMQGQLSILHILTEFTAKDAVFSAVGLGMLGNTQVK